MKKETLNKERTTEEIQIDKCKQKFRFELDEFRKEFEKLMFEEFHARFKSIKEFYDLKAFGISITEVIALGKRLEYYFDEMKKIETQIVALIDDETEE